MENKKMVKVTKLRALRAEKNISLDELGEKSGISRYSILKYESKNRNISRNSQFRICEALGIDHDTDLLELVEVKKEWLHGNTHTFD